MTLLAAAGAQPRNQSRGKAIHVARIETGLFTNRNPLHDPASWYASKYGGYPDALIDGSNMEVSNQLTMIRRPGLSQWSSVTVPDQPNWFYDWRTLNCGIKVVVDTPTSTYLQTATTQTKIFTKSAGAGQGQYQGVADTLYYGDGVDLQKVILQNCLPGSAFNWGIIAPTTAPVVTVTPTAAATVAWAASTWFSTMGIIIDANGNAQQLVSVNADPNNPNTTQFGTSGNGSPTWPAVGGTVVDGTITWTNKGPVDTWFANTGYNGIAAGGTNNQPATIYDSTSQGFYEQSNPGTGRASGGSKPPFTGVPGDQHGDNFCNWVCYANASTTPAVFRWQKGHVYQNFFVNFNANSCILEPFSPPFAAGTFTPPFGGPQTEYLITSGGGTSQATPYTPLFSATKGIATYDGQLKWVSLGSATWLPNHSYSAWTASNSVNFDAVKDPDGNLHVCIQTGTSGGTAPWQSWQALHVYAVATSIIDTNGYIQTVTTAGTSAAAHPVWSTTVGAASPVDGTVTWTNQGFAYGFHTTDGTGSGAAIWVCVGTIAGAIWTANQSYYLPVGGFFPPSTSVPYGGALIVDSNNNEQATVNTGVSKAAPHPVWATTPVGTLTTTDNTVLWKLIAIPAPTGGFATTKFISFAYSYASRTATDIYNTTAPPDWPGPLGPPTGSRSGHISTASPLFTIATSFPASVVTLTMPGSLDPQVDTIVVWATLDGGSSLFFLTEIPNLFPFQTVNISQSPFIGAASVNQFIPAPINHQNDPPPAGFLPMAFHFGRVWGAVGNFVYASGGPDVLSGNPNESFSPLNFFQFPSPVTRIVPTATGILVFLTPDVYAILGGPIFATFFPTPMVPGIGLLHYNALDIHGGVIYLYTADNQFIAMDPSGGAQRMGGAIADKLAGFDANKAFVTVHESGNDNAIFVGNGTTGWYRLNPSQFPNGTAVWSPFATITGGAGAVLSIEVSSGVHRLLVGGIGSNSSILQRDFSTYQDNGTSYTCSFTMGSINLVDPGQIAGLTFVNLRATRVGTSPICSFLLNEISGSFTTFPEAQAYPWQIYGATRQPTSLFSNAYYFRATGVPSLAEHLQIKVSFPAENFANEVLSATIFGVIEQSPEE